MCLCCRYTRNEREKQGKKGGFFPLFCCVCHSHKGKEEPSESRRDRDASLSLWRGKEKELAQGEFVSLSRLSGDRAHLHRQTPTSPMLFPLSLSLFQLYRFQTSSCFLQDESSVLYFPKVSARLGAWFQSSFLTARDPLHEKLLDFFFLRAPYLQQTGKRHDKSIEIICKKEKKFRVMISSCHRRCERAAAEAIDACNGCVPPVTRQTPFNFSFFLLLLILRRHSTLLPIARWFSWQPLRAN